MPAERTPTLSDVIRLHIERAVAAFHAGIPAQVERWDGAKQLVDVKPLVQDFYEDGEGIRQTVSLPVVQNVPVLFPGAGGFVVTFPVAVGDVVYLTIADRSLDRWKERGGEVDPADERRHDLSDAVALIGLHPKSAAWSAVPNDRMRLGKDGGAHVDITASEVLLNGGTKEVARKGDAVGPSGTAVPPTGMAGWMAAVTAALGTLTAGAFTAVPPTTLGTISEGAAGVKA